MDTIHTPTYYKQLKITKYKTSYRSWGYEDRKNALETLFISILQLREMKLIFESNVETEIGLFHRIWFGFAIFPVAD